MNNTELLKSALAKRITDEIYIHIPEPIWEEEISASIEDINATINFIANDITDEEFYYLSEVFENIAEKTKNPDFINAITERCEKVENEEWAKSIAYEIERSKDFCESDT